MQDVANSEKALAFCLVCDWKSIGLVGFLLKMDSLFKLNYTPEMPDLLRRSEGLALMRSSRAAAAGSSTTERNVERFSTLQCGVYDHETVISEDYIILSCDCQAPSRFFSGCFSGSFTAGMPKCR